MIIRNIQDVFMFWGIPVLFLLISYFLLRKNKALFIIILIAYIGLNVYHFMTYISPSERDKYNIGQRFELFFKIQSEAFFLFVIALIYWGIQKIVKRKKDHKARDIE
jgi:hypothetical protein